MLIQSKNGISPEGNIDASTLRTLTMLRGFVTETYLGKSRHGPQKKKNAHMIFVSICILVNAYLFGSLDMVAYARIILKRVCLN